MSDGEEENAGQNIPGPMTDAECETRGLYLHIDESEYRRDTRSAQRRYIVEHYTLNNGIEPFPCNCREDYEGNKCYNNTCPNFRRGVCCGDGCGPSCCNNPYNVNSPHRFVGRERTYMARVAENVGIGVFASHHINMGDWIGEYVGVVMMDANVRGDRSYVLGIPPVHQVINSIKKGNRTRCINHSCDPNLAAVQYVHNGLFVVLFYATRDIEPGAQLTFNYRWAYDRIEDAVACACGAFNCNGYIGTHRPSAPSKQSKNVDSSQTRKRVDSMQQQKQVQKVGSSTSESSGGSITFPVPYASYFRGPPNEVQRLIAACPPPLPRQDDFVETHSFLPLEQVYIVVNVDGVLTPRRGIVHQCLQSSRGGVFIYVVRVGSTDHYLPRWLVFHHEEDLIYRVQNMFSEQDRERSRNYLATPPSARDARALTDGLVVNYEGHFEAENIPATRIIPTRLPGANAIGYPTHKAIAAHTDSAGSEEEAEGPRKQVLKGIIEAAENSRRVRQVAKKQVWKRANVAVAAPLCKQVQGNNEQQPSRRVDVVRGQPQQAGNDQTLRRPFRELHEEIRNRVYLDHLLEVAVDNVALLAYSRIPPERNIRYLELRTQIEQDLRNNYFHNVTRLRRYLSYNHYRLGNDNNAHGSFYHSWCSLCGEEESFENAMQEWRHFQEFHYIVAAVDRCPKCGELHNLPSLFRRHVTVCDPEFATNLRHDQPDYILDAYADFIAMHDAGKRQLYPIPPGVPLFREIEGAPSHQRGAGSQSRKPLKVNRTTKRPEGSQINLEQVKLALQKTYKALDNWSFNYSSNPASAPRSVGQQDTGDRERELRPQERLPERFFLGGNVVDKERPGPSGTQSTRPRSKGEKRRRDSGDPEEVEIRNQESARRTRSKTKKNQTGSKRCSSKDKGKPESASVVPAKVKGSKEKAPRVPETDDDDYDYNNDDDEIVSFNQEWLTSDSD